MQMTILCFSTKKNLTEKNVLDSALLWFISPEKCFSSFVVEINFMFFAVRLRTWFSLWYDFLSYIYEESKIFEWPPKSFFFSLNRHDISLISLLLDSYVSYNTPPCMIIKNYIPDNLPQGIYSNWIFYSSLHVLLIMYNGYVQLMTKRKKITWRPFRYKVWKTRTTCSVAKLL